MKDLDIVNKDRSAYLNLRFGTPERWADIWPEAEELFSGISWEHPIAVISSIGVKESHRKKGQGSILMKVAEEKVKEAGVSHIFLRAVPYGVSRKLLNKFYKKHGFEEIGKDIGGNIYFVKDLSRAGLLEVDTPQE